MKIRSKFVANSSSSSFVCDVCGTQESGWDASLSDFEMSSCENDHTFCNCHMTKNPSDLTEKEVFDWLDYHFGDDHHDLEYYIQYKKDFREDKDKFFHDMEWHLNYDLPWILCPICTFVEIADSDIKLYLSKMTGVTESEVFAEVKKTNKRRRKLYDSEYIEYAVKKLDTTTKELKVKLKEEFENYENFYKFISEKN